MKKISAIMSIIMVFLILPFGMIKAESIEPTTDSSEVILEALDENGNLLEGAEVAVISLSNDTLEPVFQGITNNTGKLKFRSTAPSNSFDRTTSKVKDAVYEVFFVSPTGELVRSLFSVPHVVDPTGISEEDLSIIENTRQKKISVKFKGETRETPILATNEVSSNALSTGEVSTEAVGDCTPLVGYYKQCIKADTEYTADTKVASVNLGQGERVDFNLTSSAKVAINAGYKKDFNPWGIDGSVSVSSDVQTAVDYVVYGACLNGQCLLSRDIYAIYLYRYIARDIYYGNDYEYTDYQVTPLRIGGSSQKATWWANSNNYKPVNDVKAGVYGAPFAIYSTQTGEASTTKKYTIEKTYSGAFSVNTPVGAFTGGVSTQYVTSHSIKWSATDPTKVFWHYDNKTLDKYIYVTR